MSAGSGASNLGYANINPYNNSPYINGTSSNYSGSFSSNEIPGLPGLAGSKSNIDAAAGIVPGICVYKGGSKNLKQKIKNITKHYKKMKPGSKKMNSFKNKLRTRLSYRKVSRKIAGSGKTRLSYRKVSRKISGGGKTRLSYRKVSRTIAGGRSQRGGYSQYQNNMPLTQTYSVAGVNLPASELALANPPPVTVLSNNANCVDNYSHFANSGFPSRGH